MQRRFVLVHAVVVALACRSSRIARLQSLDAQPLGDATTVTDKKTLAETIVGVSKSIAADWEQQQSIHGFEWKKM